MNMSLSFRGFQLYIELSKLLTNCLKSKSLKSAKQIHAVLLSSGADETVMAIDSSLLGVYVASGKLKYAQNLFDKMSNPEIFALNWMISGMAFHGHYEEAISYFSLVYLLEKIPNKYTFSVVLKACVGLLDLRKGKQVHGMVNTMGLGDDLVVGNALVDMYCKCGKIDYAREVFDRMHVRDVASWTSMVSGYCNQGKLDQAIVLFERMKLEGLEANDFTWNALIAGYARCGDCNGAYGLFERMARERSVPDVVTWNALISGFARSIQVTEAFKAFKHMLISGVRPNHVTVTGLLPACGLMGSIRRGTEVHGLIYRLGLQGNVYVSSALVDMYSKCGTVKDARTVFDEAPVRNIPLWNAMIGCYGKHGLVDASIQLFETMQEEGFRVNEVTLACMLSACSHGGLVQKGMEIFRSMERKFRVKASELHYGCIIDLLCRAGRMEKAFELVKEMPYELTYSIVGAFFNGCKIHGRKDLAKCMAEELLKMNIKRPGGFVTLSNILAADGEWEDVESMRKLMQDMGIHKRPGQSSVDNIR